MPNKLQSRKVLLYDQRVALTLMVVLEPWILHKILLAIETMIVLYGVRQVQLPLVPFLSISFITSGKIILFFTWIVGNLWSDEFCNIDPDHDGNDR